MKHLIKNKHWELSKEYNTEKLLYLLIDRPTEITTINGFIWKNNENKFHRDYDLPSYIWDDGDVWWCEKSKLHKENNKPAIICNDGCKQYWINGKSTKIEFLNETFD